MTRKEYIANSSELHRQYNAQFVNNSIKVAVKNYFGIDALLNSNDKHLNDIPLEQWDSVGTRFKSHLNKEMKKQGDFVSMAGIVCVMKEAAKQLN